MIKLLNVNYCARKYGRFGAVSLIWISKKSECIYELSKGKD